jgi:hypothetical protein
MKRLLVVPVLLLALSGCRDLSPELLADAPPERYWIEYYEISKG